MRPDNRTALSQALRPADFQLIPPGPQLLDSVTEFLASYCEPRIGKEKVLVPIVPLFRPPNCACLRLSLLDEFLVPDSTRPLTNTENIDAALGLGAPVNPNEY